MTPDRERLAGQTNRVIIGRASGIGDAREDTPAGRR